MNHEPVSRLVILIHKIYRATKDAGNETTTSEYRFVIRVLAESGILYLSVTVAHFVLWFMPDAVAVNILTAFVRSPCQLSAEY